MCPLHESGKRCGVSPSPRPRPRPSRARRTALAALAAVVAAACGPQPAPGPAGPERRPYNVLLISLDDLRPDLGCLGDARAATPNLDALASAGVVFGRAYCQIPLCSPSRLSILSGLRPETLGVFDQAGTLRGAAPDAVTLPQHFRANGWVTQAVGKVFHGGHDDPASWSLPNAWQESLPEPDDEEGGPQREVAGIPGARSGPDRDTSVWRALDSDRGLRDREACDAARAALRELRDERFFLAVGFARPHIPWVVPAGAYDAHPLEAIPDPVVPGPPEGAAAFALHGFRELRRFADVPDTGPVPAAKARELARAYAACVTYVDGLVGELVAELEALGLRDDTVVVVWSDHGVHLGEQGMWTKQTLFEASLRVPLVVSWPDARGGGVCDALVETVDLYPTLADLCGLPAAAGLDGRSFAPLLADPGRRWKRGAFSVLLRYAPGFGVVRGASVTDGRVRYVEWSQDGRVVAEELYDLEGPRPESENLVRTGGAAGRLVDARRLLAGGPAAAGP